MLLKIAPTTANEIETPIFNLYVQLLEAWNAQDAHAFAAGFADNGSVIGFDGSLMNGLSEIEMTLSGIFGHHKTAEYVALVREIRFLSPQTALLRAVVGMIPPGSTAINQINERHPIVSCCPNR
ncbi:MAG: SgcJ/EcaC family oxidoreductase [Chloroflexi bacterium]|nr:SgcJ/EcaC family oxidoreductase [Chloroflexota bacterium]